MKSDNEQTIVKRDNEQTLVKSDNEQTIVKSDNEQTIVKSDKEQTIVKSDNEQTIVLKIWKKWKLDFKEQIFNAFNTKSPPPPSHSNSAVGDFSI